MKKACLYLQLLVICFSGSCKKDKEINPDVVSVDDSFIRSISVNGAKEVKLDLDKRIIQIVLPEGHTENNLDLKLDLPEGSHVETFPGSILHPPDHIKYTFRGASPLTFTVTKKDIQLNNVKQYTVFVKQEGRLSAGLVSDPVFYPSDNELSVYAEFILTSGIGSIPETPNDASVLASSLTDPARGLKSEGAGHALTNTITIYPGSQFLKSDRLILGISYGDKKFDFPEIRQIKRSKIEGAVNPYIKFLKTIPKDRLMEVSGGVFLPENKYKIELSNDRMPGPRAVTATFVSYGTLAFTLPGDLPDDHYLFQLYEGNTLIGKSLEPVASDSVRKSVGEVWTEFAECPTIQIIQGHDAGRIVLDQGQTFYAMPLPAIIDGTYGGGMDSNKPLPGLELKSAGETLLLQPTVKADWCYGDGGHYVYYGVFKLPANAASGRYEARFISKAGAASLPYWSQIEIR